MRKLADAAYRLALLFLIVLILASAATLAAMVLLDVPGAAARIGEPDPQLNPVERIFLSTYLALHETQLNEPISSPELELQLDVEEGQPAQAVLDALEQGGLLPNPLLFRLYLRYLGYERGIEAGSFNLNGGMSMAELALDLQNAGPGEISFTVIPGWRMEEIAAALASSFSGMQNADILSVFSMRAVGTSFEEDIPAGSSLEGYLFPSTYTFPPDATPAEIAFQMLDRFDEQVTQELREAFSTHGLTLHEGVTLASIVEREAILEDEMPLIASVYLNRLAIDMRLEADPTVQYPLGIEGRWWKSPLFYEDLAFDSPYNTYLYPDLPPGPIANPSLAALEAVAYPETSTYYYFRAACDGSGRHLFAETYDEHLQNACPPD